MIGNKATAFFKRFGGKVLAQQTGPGDNPRLADVIGSVQVMLKAYEEGQIDRLFLVFNKFVNTMKQEPVIDQLLPLPKADCNSQEVTAGITFTSRIQRQLLDNLTEPLRRVSGVSGCS